MRPSLPSVSAVNETKLDPAHFFKTRRERVVFVDYQNGTAAVPELQFENYASYGDLLYWYTEDGKASETKDSQQFLPGESITEKENGIQSGTTLCAVAESIALSFMPTVSCLITAVNTAKRS